MEIKITPSGGSSITLPMLPEKLQIGADAKFMTYNIISLGEVKLPRGRAPEEVSFSAIFPGKHKKSQPFVSNWKAPDTLIKLFEKWRNNGTTVTLLIAGTVINMDMKVSSFKGKYSGDGDFYYDVKFIEAREIKIYTIKEKGIAKKTEKRPPSKVTKKTTTKTKAKTSTYTIRSGDTLWGIAQRKLGKGSRYYEIYKLNKNKIESAARKYGYGSSNGGNLIFPGTKLTIPKK